MPSPEPKGRGDDPRRAVAPTWCPDPLEEEGAAELARRLVLAPVERWSAEALTPLVADRPSPVRGEPPGWPAEPERTLRRPLKSPRYVLWTALAALLVAFVELDATQQPGTNVDSARTAGYVAAGIGVALLLVRRLIVRSARGAGLRRAVRAAAGRAPRGLEQGLPGMAGVVAVLDGRSRGGHRRLALVHVRAAADDGGPGDLEVRTLAWRELRSEEEGDPVAALRDLWTVADGAGARTAGAQRSARTLARLTTGLGRAAATAGAPPLYREPLAWLASAAVPVLLAASIKHTIAGTWAAHGLVNRSLGYIWVLTAAALLWAAARRIRDPVAR